MFLIIKKVKCVKFFPTFILVLGVGLLAVYAVVDAGYLDLIERVCFLTYTFILLNLSRH